MTTTATHTVTLEAALGTVLATITANGETVATFTTTDGDRFIARLDRKMGLKGYRRNGYNLVNGILTATVDAKFAV